MKQIKRLKRGKVSLFLAAAVLSLGILSGCGAESKEAKEARMTGIEQLNAGNYQSATMYALKGRFPPEPLWNYKESRP